MISCVTTAENNTSSITEEENKVQEVKEVEITGVEGLWLLVWDHNTSYGEPFFTPSSYGYAENPNLETLYLFNEDGSGFKIDRDINIYGMEGDDYMTLLNSIGHESVEYETLETYKDPFTWSLNDSVLNINGEEFNILFNPDERCNFEKSIDLYNLGKEIHILEIGAFKRISDIDKDDFISLKL